MAVAISANLPHFLKIAQFGPEYAFARPCGHILRRIPAYSFTSHSRGVRAFVRAAIAISVVAHALLWAPLAFPSGKPLPPTQTNPIEVEIVTPREAPEAPKPQPPPTAEDRDAAETSEAQSTPAPAPQQREPAQQTAQAPKPAAVAATQQAPQAPNAAPSATRPSPQAQVAAAEPIQPAAEPQLAEAGPDPAADLIGPQVWGSWLDSPLMTASIGFDSVGSSAKLSDQEITALKARLQQCWSPPPGLAGASSNLVVVLRVSFAPTGAIVGEPNLIAASATTDGAALMQTAMRALQQCQPFNFLPAAKYKEWRNLDLSFSPAGLSALPKI